MFWYQNGLKNDKTLGKTCLCRFFVIFGLLQAPNITKPILFYRVGSKLQFGWSHVKIHKEMASEMSFFTRFASHPDPFKKNFTK